MSSSHKKRKRVSKEQIRDNAKKGGGESWLNLPEGVESWAPKEEGTVSLDVVPYETTVEKEIHPDGMETGTIWYKSMIVIHRGVGPNNLSLVCPACRGLPCPIHEERNKLAKNKSTDKKVLADLNGRRMVLMNILHPKDRHKRAILCFSLANFWGSKNLPGLKVDMEKGDESYLNFWDVKDGYTLHVRFTKSDYEGKDFFQASRFDFKKRKDMDEDRTLSKSVDLDTCPNILPYDKIKKLFFQGAEDSKSKSKSSKSHKSSKSSESSVASESVPSKSSASGKASKSSAVSSSSKSSKSSH